MTPKKPIRKKRSAGDWRPAFIATLRGCGIVREACKKAGVSRKVAYDHRDKDEEFAMQWDEALEDACDDLVKCARARAKTVSDVLLIFLLKSHRPEVYRDTSRHELTGKNGAPIATSHVPLNYSKLTDDELNFLSGIAARLGSGGDPAGAKTPEVAG